jgi:hypothetical protein
MSQRRKVKRPRIPKKPAPDRDVHAPAARH